MFNSRWGIGRHLMNHWQLMPFHIAIQVRDIEEARAFYGDVLGCEEGRSNSNWVDFNLFGHQFVCHLNPNLGKSGKLQSHYNSVDGQRVPVPHFGVVMEMAQWKALVDRLRKRNIEFLIDPYIRFKHQTGEQATMFFLDPSGNALEFKAFKAMSTLFAK